jgi:cytochrome P450
MCSFYAVQAALSRSGEIRMVMDTAFTFDRFAPPHLDDPYPLYRDARERAGVFYADAFDVWVVTRYDDVRDVLMDPARFSSAYLIHTPHAPAAGVTEILQQGHPEVRILLNQDPPEHARARSLVAKAFAPRRARALEPRVQEIADRLVDAFAGAGHADLVRQLTLPLPLQVICELIGLPLRDAEQVRAWTDDLKLLTSFGATPEQQLQAARGSVAFEHYLADQVEQRRREGRDDLLTDIMTARVVGEQPLTTDEIISLLKTLVFGGHETTANLIGTALLLLLQRPELWRAAPDDPRLVDAAVEEALRLDAPVQGMYRRAVADTEVAGVTIPAGAQVFALFGSANRDPAIFADPDGFDPGRTDADRHLSFGRGIHFCIGAALARLEAHTAITTLSGRIPGLRLAPGFRAPYLPNLLHRGPSRLDAVWDQEDTTQGHTTQGHTTRGHTT